MSSNFAWLDYDARERRAMLGIVDLFREKGTVDELGLGVIRDAFATGCFQVRPLCTHAPATGFSSHGSIYSWKRSGPPRQRPRTVPDGSRLTL